MINSNNTAIESCKPACNGNSVEMVDLRYVMQNTDFFRKQIDIADGELLLSTVIEMADPPAVVKKQKADYPTMKFVTDICGTILLITGLTSFIFQFIIFPS